MNRAWHRSVGCKRCRQLLLLQLHSHCTVHVLQLQRFTGIRSCPAAMQGPSCQTESERCCKGAPAGRGGMDQCSCCGWARHMTFV